MKEQKPEKENDSSNRVVVVPYARREELKRQREKKSSFRQGPWSSEERLLFLKGLRLYGEGRWKEIGSVVTTR